MAIKVLFLSVCDAPHHRGKDVPAESLPPIPVGNKGPRKIELCDEDRAKLSFDEVYAIYEKYGRKPDEEDDAAENKYVCQFPGCVLAFPHGTTRGKHHREAHPQWTPPSAKAKGKSGSAKGAAERPEDGASVPEEAAPELPVARRRSRAKSA